MRVSKWVQVSVWVYRWGCGRLWLVVRAWELVKFYGLYCIWLRNLALTTLESSLWAYIYNESSWSPWQHFWHMHDWITAKSKYSTAHRILLTPMPSQLIITSYTFPDKPTHSFALTSMPSHWYPILLCKPTELIGDLTFYHLLTEDYLYTDKWDSLINRIK